jgi:hypothetical protein
MAVRGRMAQEEGEAMRGRDEYGIGLEIGQALGLAIGRSGGTPQGKMDPRKGVWVRFGSFSGKDLRLGLRESVLFQRVI